MDAIQVTTLRPEVLARRHRWRGNDADPALRSLMAQHVVCVIAGADHGHTRTNADDSLQIDGQKSGGQPGAHRTDDGGVSTEYRLERASRDIAAAIERSAKAVHGATDQIRSCRCRQMAELTDGSMRRRRSRRQGRKLDVIVMQSPDQRRAGTVDLDQGTLRDVR
jgi:hypothetical protein